MSAQTALREPETVEITRAFHARPMSVDAELYANREAERAATDAGMEWEASRCRTRAHEIKTTRTRASGRKKLNIRRASKRDPLSRVDLELQRAGELLREHLSGVSLPGGTPDMGVFIQGGVARGLEDGIDARSRGNYAWIKAIEAIKDKDFVDPTIRVITHRLPLVKSAERAKGHTGGRAQAGAKTALVQALDAAACVFKLSNGVGLDSGREPDDKSAG